MKTILESAPHIHCLELHTSCQFEKLWIALEDSFADKATGTLYKRSRALWCYYWLRDSGRSAVCPRSGCMIWVMDETRGQLQHMDNLFYRRLDFFTELAGCRSMDPMFSAVKRVANSIYRGKRTLQQGLGKFERWHGWENFVSDQPSYLRLITGYLLCCVMFCCRFSDIMRAEQWCISKHADVTIMESGTTPQKINMTVEKTTKFEDVSPVKTCIVDGFWSQPACFFRKTLSISYIPGGIYLWESPLDSR